MPIFSSTVNDLQSGASYRYDSSANNDRIKVEDDVVNRNIFDRGGSIECWVYGDPADGIIPSRIILKDGTAAVGFSLGGYGNTTGVFYFDLIQYFNTTLGRWNTLETITLYEWHHLVVTYDNSSVSNDPIFYVDGVSQTVTESSTPVGTRVSDENYDIYIGNRQSLARSLCGVISSVRMHNRILTADEVVDAYNGQSVSYEYRGASQTNQVENGGFSSDTAWNKQTGWTISGGYAIATSIAATGLYQDHLNYIDGKRVRVTYTVSDPSGGSMSGGVRMIYPGITPNQGSGQGIDRTSPGTYTEEFTTTNNNTILFAGKTGVTSSFRLSDVSAQYIGNVAEFLPTGISADRWVDTSGNDLHGIVTGAIATNHKTGSLTLENIHTTSMAFAGTANDSALDSYEEGTFTPVITGSTLGTWNATGQYTRIGNTVHIIISEYETLSPLDLVGNVSITGLPYEPASWQSIGFLPTRGGYEQGYGLEYTPWAVIDTNSVMHLHDYSQMNYINAYSTLAATYNANNFKQNGVTTLILDWQFSYLID
jgi:hypothetical protein